MKEQDSEELWPWPPSSEPHNTLCAFAEWTWSLESTWDWTFHKIWHEIISITGQEKFSEYVQCNVKLDFAARLLREIHRNVSCFSGINWTFPRRGQVGGAWLIRFLLFVLVVLAFWGSISLYSQWQFGSNNLPASFCQVLVLQRFDTSPLFWLDFSYRLKYYP